ncbi:MAG TPA: M28 family peptidase [Solirubrobacteraceae bacterium]|nr:M28 family peptidase [Solirubrobacteraceae bacterium]
MTDGTRISLDAGAIGATLDDLAQIGNRFCGTAGELEARSYVLGRFGELGLTVHLEEFAYLAWMPGPASCVAGSPGGARTDTYDAHPLQYTAPGPVSGQAIYLGGAEAADFARLDAAGVDLAGTVVVAHSVFPFDLVGLLSARGIAGFVHVCETPDGIVGNFTGALYPPPLAPPWEGRPLPYAGVTIGHLAARELISTLTCGAPVQLTIGHEGGCTPARTANVVAVIPGRGEEEVVLSAHYDSQAEGPCVYDNGSGLSALLDTARALRDLRPERRVVLVASSAEEIGVWGATAYVDAHRGELARAVAMVNLDGLASAYPAQREVWSIHSGLLALAVQTGAQLGWRADHVYHRRSTFSDHAPFGDAGVPSVLCWRPDYPYYHSRGDVRELVDEAAVAQTGSVGATIAARLALGADVPDGMWSDPPGAEAGA